MAVRRTAVSAEVIVGTAGALIEDAVGRAGIVGVVTLLRNVALQISAGVDHLEVTNFAVDGPGRVCVAVLGILRRKQRRRQTRERGIVIAVGLGREGTLGLELLVRFRNQQVPIGCNLPAERDAAARVVDRVEVVFDQRVVVVLALIDLLVRRQLVAVVLAGHRVGVVQVIGAEVGRLAGESRELVVDVAAVVISVDHRAHGQLALDDRDVDHRVECAVGPAASGAAEAALDPGLELAELGLVGDVAHHTGLRTAAEERALRTFENFDALDVGDIDVGVARRELHRLIIEIDRNVREAADRGRGLLTGKATRQTAQEDAAIARAVVREGHVGGVLQQVAEGGDVQLAQRVGAERLKGQRHVLDRLVAALCGHDDHIGTGSSILSLRRRLRQCEFARAHRNGRRGARHHKP